MNRTWTRTVMKQAYSRNLWYTETSPTCGKELKTQGFRYEHVTLDTDDSIIGDDYDDDDYYDVDEDDDDDDDR